MELKMPLNLISAEFKDVHAIFAVVVSAGDGEFLAVILEPDEDETIEESYWREVGRETSERNLVHLSEVIERRIRMEMRNRINLDDIPIKSRAPAWFKEVPQL
jgi:hypothetical protein